MLNNLVSMLEKPIMPAFFDTLYMVGVSILISVFFGALLAILLSITNERGLNPNKAVYKVLNSIVNTVRSLPFIILTVSIIPFTRFIVGTTIGKTAAIIPLAITGAPFLARVIENSLNEVSRELVEASKSFGASDIQILSRIMIPEAIPSIISGITLATVSLLNASAMAAAIGAGGLGSVALIYGYQHYNPLMMYTTVVVIIMLVQVIEKVGGALYNKMK